MPPFLYLRNFYVPPLRHDGVMPSNKNLGNAGEFYVLAQLAQRGYIAGKTDDGQTLIDVIATDPESLNTVNIQVKTRKKN